MNIRFRNVTQGTVFLDKVNFRLKLLLFSTWYAKILTVDWLAHRKETQDSDLYARDRRILHTGRDRRYSQSHRRYGYQTLEKEQNAWLQVRRFLESKQKRVLGICSQTEECQARYQINKAGTPQQSEIVAVSSLSNVWTTTDNEPGNSYERNAYMQYRRCTQASSRDNLKYCLIYRRVARRKGARLYVFLPLYSSLYIVVLIFSK